MAIDRKLIPKLGRTSWILIACTITNIYFPAKIKNDSESREINFLEVIVSDTSAENDDLTDHVFSMASLCFPVNLFLVYIHIPKSYSCFILSNTSKLTLLVQWLQFSWFLSQLFEL